MTDDHRTLKIWAAMMIFAVAVAGTIMMGTPGVTGYFSYDTGPNPTFNPDFVTESDFYSGATSALVAIFGVLIVQVMVYFVVKRFYSRLEE